MTIKSLIGLAAGAAALIAIPASAADLDDQIELCAAAAQEAGLADEDSHRVKFIDIRGGRVKTLTVDLVSNEDGETITATCSIQRGEVTGVAPKA